MTEEQIMNGTHFHTNECRETHPTKWNVVVSSTLLRRNGPTKVDENSPGVFTIPTIDIKTRKRVFITNENVDSFHHEDDCPLKR